MYEHEVRLKNLVDIDDVYGSVVVSEKFSSWLKGQGFKRSRDYKWYCEISANDYILIVVFNTVEDATQCRLTWE